MTGKEYLRQAFLIHQKILALERHRQDLRADMYGVRSPSNMSPDIVQSSITGDKLEKYIALIDEDERRIADELIRLHDKQNEIAYMLEKLDNGRYYHVLYQRYILCNGWKRIAENMQYEIHYLFRLHGKALKAFEEIFNDNRHGQADA